MVNRLARAFTTDHRHIARITLERFAHVLIFVDAKRVKGLFGRDVKKRRSRGRLIRFSLWPHSKTVKYCWR